MAHIPARCCHHCLSFIETCYGCGDIDFRQAVLRRTDCQTSHVAPLFIFVWMFFFFYLQLVTAHVVSPVFPWRSLSVCLSFLLPPHHSQLSWWSSSHQPWLLSPVHQIVSQPVFPVLLFQIVVWDSVTMLSLCDQRLQLPFAVFPRWLTVTLPGSARLLLLPNYNELSILCGQTLCVCLSNHMLGSVSSSGYQAEYPEGASNPTLTWCDLALHTSNPLHCTERIISVSAPHC